MIIAFRTASFALLACALLAPPQAAAQTGRAASNWFCNCGGRTVEIPNSMGSSAPNCQTACYGSGGGSSGGGASAALSAMQQQTNAMAHQFGGMLGRMLRDALFGNPEQEAELARQRAAEQAALARAAEEDRLRREEQHRRLVAAMIGPGSPAGGLGMMGVGESRPIFNFSDDAFMQTVAQLPAGSAAAQLSHASFYSEQAAKAGSDEDAATLAEAAFNTTIGVPVDLAVPQTAPALRVADADVSSVAAVRGEYRDAAEATQRSTVELAEASRGRDAGQSVLRDIASQLESAERAFMQSKPADRKARQVEVVQKRALVDEATAFALAQDKREAEARAALEAAQARMHKAAGGALALLDRLRQRSNRPADAYRRGIADGSLCLPANLAAACPPQSEAACAEKYNSGYRVGERAREAKLLEAHGIGAAEKASGNSSFVGFNHPKSAGPCRVRWLEAFNSGYAGAPFNMAGR